MWGGHSCPPLLTLFLVWVRSADQGQWQENQQNKINNKIKSNGGGQECPPHTSEHSNSQPSMRAVVPNCESP